jgi:Ca2+-binding RTX toxin-like protein
MATINGTFLPDILLGTSDDDEINGFGGSDTISGGAGNDRIDGGAGDDVLTGDDGNDILIGGPGAATALSVYNGGAGNDLMFASDLGVAEDFDGGDDIDTVSFATRAEGVTTLLSVAGVPLLDTLRNVENVIGSAFDDNFTGDDAANRFEGRAGNDVLNGGGGDDVLIGGLGVDATDGGLGNDWFFVDNAGDTVAEGLGQGADRVFASASYTLAPGAEVEIFSTDWHAGTAAIDLTGNELANTMYGNAGNNVLNGGGGADLMVGWAGNDWFFVDNAGDAVAEVVGDGADRVFAGASWTLSAGAEVELLTTDFHTGTSAIDLTGNELANTIHGNDGANVLDGKDGSDSLVGRAGDDTFAFTTALGPNNVDLVFGFEHGGDKIALDDAVFAQLGGPGALNASAFVIGTAAGDADDRVIYDGATGQLYYDADGSGGGAAILFATLTGAPTLTASDFQVI